MTTRSRAGRNPDRDRHRDARRRRRRPSRSGSRASSRGSRAALRGRRRVIERRRAASEPALSRRPHDLGRRDLADRGGRVRRRARPERRRQVDAPASAARPAAALRRHGDASSARHPAGPTRASATCRSATASTRRRASAASTSCASGSTATAGASRSPADARRGRGSTRRSGSSAHEAYARRPIGECSGGEQQRLLIAQALASAGRSCCFLDEPLDSLDLPNQTAVSALLDRICRSRGDRRPPRRARREPDAPRTSTASSTSPEAASLSGTPADVITSETLSDALRRPGRGAAHLGRAARRRRPRPSARSSSRPPRH